AITVFSPDGRLFQVEYAREAVRTGTPCVGVVGKDCIVLAAYKRISSPLVVPESHEKIFQVDKHVAAASSGLVADARKLVDFARLEGQKNRLTFGDEIPVETLAKKIGDHIQMFTQYAGVRPYGVSLLIAGMDSDFRLFETDPSGALFEYKAAAIGSGKKTVEQFFEKEYKDNMPVGECVKLALRAIKKAVEEKVMPANVDVAIIERGKGAVQFLSREDVGKHLSDSK
ncbi:MAG: archaeal proteasome endopeptidase complex subunit alpha, partial [Candidatus Micrarchaeota archaeon]